MRGRYTAALNGIELSEISDKIYILDISFDDPIRQNKTSSIAGRNGRLLHRWETESTSVAIQFEIHEQNIRWRSSIMEEIQKWAIGGGFLTVGDRPDRRLHVVCDTLPTIKSSLKWTQACMMKFAAYVVPFWEDAIQRKVTINGGESANVFAPGIAAPACVECTVVNAGLSPITQAQISAGNTFFRFEEISLLPGKSLEIQHDDRGFLTAMIDGESVLFRRTPESSDDLELEPAKMAQISADSDGETINTFAIRGRYA